MNADAREIAKTAEGTRDTVPASTSHGGIDLRIGKETTIVGRKSKTEGHLGRSLVVTLDGGKFFAQVDHRTIKYLIIKNVKYIVN